MWFEVLPSAVIITVVMAVPGYALYGMHKLAFGTPYKRCTDERWHRMCYTHDRKVDANGDPYNVHGLDDIKDE